MGAKLMIIAGATLVAAVTVTNFGRLQSNSNVATDVALAADAIPARTIISDRGVSLPDEYVKPDRVVSLVQLRKLVEECMAYRKRRMSGEEGFIYSLDSVASEISHEINQIYTEGASAELLDLINGDAKTCYDYARRAERNDFTSVFVPEMGDFMSPDQVKNFHARRDSDEALEEAQQRLELLKKMSVGLAEIEHRKKQECFDAYRANGAGALGVEGCIDIFGEFGFPE